VGRERHKSRHERGAPPAVAEQVAASLVRADLRGHESHGVVRLATAYGSMVEAEAVDPAATATVDTRDGATVAVDGRRAFGQHTGRVAVNSGVSTPTVTVPGSADRRLSTNPIAVGLPAFDARPFPVVLDVATSQVAHGKVTRRHVDGETMPADWTVTDDGEGVPGATAFEEGVGALLSGEPEHRTATDRRADGVPVGDRTVAALADVAADLGVQFVD
jgi:uncharacterized oxidoreductase